MKVKYKDYVDIEQKGFNKGFWFMFKITFAGAVLVQLFKIW